MSHVAQLTRFPVKGFAGEPAARLHIDDRGVVGDRAFAFRLVEASATATATATADDEWSPKRSFMNMVNTPSAVRLRLQVSGATLTLLDDERVLGRATLADRAPLERALEIWLQAQPEAPADVMRVALTGDGIHTAYHDTPERNVSMHSAAASVAAIAQALSAHALADLRFRSNIVVGGVPAFAEHEWIGRQITLGDATFVVQAPIVRCIATHVDPRTGVRALDILRTLTHGLGQSRPMVGVYLRPTAPKSVIERGAPLRLS